MGAHLMKEWLARNLQALWPDLVKQCGGCHCKSMGAHLPWSPDLMRDIFLDILIIQTLVILLVVVILFVVAQCFADRNPTDGTELSWISRIPLPSRTPFRPGENVWG